MTAYYNEWDPFAAAWLRELIADGLIAPGDVDERSICDVQAADLAGYDQHHFFAGIGGWSYALRLAGWPDDRQVWTGSCPCQPFSSAGKQQGVKDARHLAPVWLRLVAECRPRVIFGEQVAAAIRHGWLDALSDELERLHYAVGAAVLPACSVGAPHRRERLWFVADTNGWRCGERVERHGAQKQDPADRSPLRADAGGCSADAAVADTENSDRRAELQQGSSRSRRPGLAGDRAADPLGNATREGPKGERSIDSAGCEGCQRQPGLAGEVGAEPWRDTYGIRCADGTRPVPTQPGIFPLAHGISGRMAVRRTLQRAGSEVQEEHWYSRVCALRGAGNAIVPQVAAAFIEAYCEVSE